MSDVLLSADGVVLRYRTMDRPALDGVSLSVRQGVPLGIVGESGSGKSSLIRCLLGLEHLSAGRVAYRGIDLSAMDARQRRAFRTRVQMVFQDPFNSLNPRMTIGQTLAEVLTVHGLASSKEARGRVHQQLLEVGLDPAMASRYPHELSGGQRQRVGIARAIALEPEILLADEPVSALDVSVQAQILELLGRLGREKGITVVLIAHDLAVVGHACRYLVVLERGHLVEEGPSRDVIAHPSHPYTQALLAAVPDIAPLMRDGGL